ncbi:MAG: serine/threonine-protein kinase [Polyangiaceae bacterium]
MSNPSRQDVRIVGRYALYGVIASGGMATVHFGRLLGPAGFSRTVAIKRLHAQYAADPEFVSMFLDEARLAARIRHPNVVPTLDVVATDGELFLVMEYVPGESLSKLWKIAREKGRGLPPRIVSSIITGVLHGLHAAHEAKDERGMPLGIVHRDVSPQNVHVGTDGIPKVLDFGVAKAAGRIQTTRDGQIKGKLAYMAPEQLRGAGVTRSCDIYAAGVMLWELLTGERLFFGDNEGVVVNRVLEGKITPPSHYLIKQGTTLKAKHQHLMAQLDQVVLRAAHRDPAQRFATAKDMALELESCVAPATVSQVAEWVEQVGAEVLQMRAHKVAEIESLSATPAPFDRPSDVHRLLTESNGATVPLGASSHAELQPQHVRPSEPPRPPSAHPGTLSSSASYVGLPAAAPAQKRGNGWLVAVGIAVIVLFLGFGSIVAIKMKEHGAELGGLPDADTSSTPTAATAPPPPSTVGVLDLFDAGETLNLDDAGAPGTVTPPPSASATATSKPPVVHWPPTPATVRPPPTIPTKAADPCLTNPYFFEDGIKKVRPECRSKIN